MSGESNSLKKDTVRNAQSLQITLQYLKKGSIKRNKIFKLNATFQINDTKA